MGYGLMAYAVDMACVRAVLGSRDQGAFEARYRGPARLDPVLCQRSARARVLLLLRLRPQIASRAARISSHAADAMP
jgi:hypothetical protein